MRHEVRSRLKSGPKGPRVRHKSDVETRESGGGVANPLAAEFVDFLQRGLGSGSFSNSRRFTPGTPGFDLPDSPLFGEELRTLSRGTPGSFENNPLSPEEQTTGIAQGINDLIRGRTPTDFNPEFSPTSFNPSGVSASFDPTSFSPSSFNSRFNPTNFDTSRIPGSFNLDEFDFSSLEVPNLGAGRTDISGLRGGIRDIIRTESERDIAALRERATAGGGSRGTGSEIGEAFLRRDIAPRIATALGQLDLQANEQAFGQRFREAGLGLESGRAGAEAVSRRNQDRATRNQLEQMAARLGLDANQLANMFGLEGARFGQEGERLRNLFGQQASDSANRFGLDASSQRIRAQELTNMFGLQASEQSNRFGFQRDAALQEASRQRNTFASLSEAQRGQFIQGLLSLLSGLSGRGISQATTNEIVTPGEFEQFVGLVEAGSGFVPGG